MSTLLLLCTEVDLLLTFCVLPSFSQGHGMAFWSTDREDAFGGGGARGGHLSATHCSLWTMQRTGWNSNLHPGEVLTNRTASPIALHSTYMYTCRPA